MQGLTTWLTSTWLVAAGVAVLGAVGIALLSYGYRDTGTLALALALTGLAQQLLWKWRL
ncbi:MAG: hypothetical protein L6271_10095 [Desulfobacteraceae bacterium]|nr:hypothetical protein [Desulfobacteraceae bacterium]